MDPSTAGNMTHAPAGSSTNFHGSLDAHGEVVQHIRLSDVFQAVGCGPKAKVNSLGVFNHENPLTSSLPLLLMQACLMNFLCKAFRFILRRLHQPVVISDVAAGIMIGPSFLGRNKTFAEKVFPPQSFYLLRIMGTLGILFFFFNEGLKLDPKLIFKTGRRELIIAIASMTIPFTAIMVTYYIKIKTIAGFLIFIGILMSLTSFPVLNPILREFNILNSQLGQLALSIVMVNYVGSWMMIISFHMWYYGGDALWMMMGMYFLGLILFILLMILVVRPVSRWIISQTPEGGTVDRTYIILMQFGAAVTGLVGDIIGIGSSHGSLIMGMSVPDGPPLAAALVQKTEVILRHVFLPFFYASIGLRMDMSKITEFRSWTNLVSVVVIGFFFKVIGTLMPALYYKIPFQKALALGLMTNFRGIVELYLYSNWADRSIMSREVFKIMVLSTLVATAIASPLVRILTWKSEAYIGCSDRTMEHCKSKGEIRILTCLRSQDTVPMILSLLEASYFREESPICVYVMNLVELVGRANPILIEHNNVKKSCITSQASCIISAFRKFEKSNSGSISVRPFTVMAPYRSMHHDICQLALERKVSILILPYHRQRTRDGMETIDSAFKVINPNILANAPCSVGLLVDLGGRTRTTSHFLGSQQHRVSVLFSGGPDCREVLSYALRMTRDPEVILSVVRFLSPGKTKKNDVERQRDDEVIASFRIGCVDNKRVVFKEETVRNGEETIKAIRSMGSEYDLLMLGRRMGMGLAVVEGLTDWNQSPELGVIGDFLSTPDFFDGPVAVLVVQQLSRKK